MKRKLALLLVVLVAIGCGALTVRFYEYIFAKTVRGRIVRVERVNTAEAVISGQGIPKEQLFSFAVAIKDDRGEIHTASSEDRQWAVAAAGQCADARFFPYPPWQLDKGGTYHNARLERLYDCGSPAASDSRPSPAASAPGK